MILAHVEVVKNINSAVAESRIRPIILPNDVKLEKAFARLLQALFFSAIMHFTKEG